MRLGHKLTIQFIGTETRVNVIVIRAGIAMIGAVRLIVFQKRSAPDRSRTEILDIIEMVNDTLDISSVTAEKSLTICLFSRLVSIVP